MPPRRPHHPDATRVAAPGPAHGGSAAALLQHCLELLAPLGAVGSRRMFGGHALYAGPLCIAILADEQLYLKVDGQTRDAFAAAGCQPFSYATKDGRRTALSYWSAPGDAMDSPAAMRDWARLAQAAALRKAAADAASAQAKAERSAARATRAAAKADPASATAPTGRRKPAARTG